MKQKTFGIKGKIFLNVFLTVTSVLIAGLIAGLISGYLLVKLTWKIEEYKTHFYELQRVADDIKYLDEVLTLCTVQYVQTRFERYKKSYEKQARLLDEALLLANQKGSNYDREIFKRTSRINKILISREEQIFKLTGKNRIEEAKSVLYGDYQSYKLIYKSLMNEFFDNNRRQNLNRLNSQIREANQAIGAVLTTCVLVLIFTGYFGYRTIKGVTSPINLALERIKDIAEGEGDLNKRLEIDTRDEIGEFSYWLNQFLDKLKNIIMEIQTVGLSSTQYSKQLNNYLDSFSGNTQSQSTAAEESSAAIEELIASVNNVQQTISLSVKDTENLHKHIEGISERSLRLNHSIENLSLLALESARHVQSGEKLVNNATEAMSNISDSTSRISQIMSIISEISDKTNLLSLNAAIEAARAGDAGRGFAVVADEISKLAERTNLSVREIDGLIQETNDLVETGGEGDRHIHTNAQ